MVSTTACISTHPRGANPTLPYFIKTKVLDTTSGTLDNFVPAPTRNQVLSDLLIGLKRFRNSVRWKWFFLSTKDKELTIEEFKSSVKSNKLSYSFEDLLTDMDRLSEEKDLNVHNPIDNQLTSTLAYSTVTNPTYMDDDADLINKGLGTNAKLANRFNPAPLASVPVEAFIKDAERSIIQIIKDGEAQMSGSMKRKNKNIRKLLKELEKNPQLMVLPTDKTRLLSEYSDKIGISPALDKIRKTKYFL